MRALLWVLVLSLTLMLAMTLSTAAEEGTEVAEKVDIPDAVTEAFANDYPEMVIAGVEIEEIDGVTYYEIELGEGEMDVIYLADGTQYSVEQAMNVEDLPQEVTDALTAVYPDGEVEEVEMITRGEENEYEVIVVIEGEEEDLVYEVLVTADGKIVSESQILDEEDEDEDAPGDIDEDDEE